MTKQQSYFFKSLNKIPLLGIVILLVLAVACTKKPELSKAITDRAQTPRLRATEISNIISDSGVTRYRMTAEEWLVYDQSEEPYWLFPKGLHFDTFDEQFNVDAQIDCRHAIYYDKKQLWVLTDSVRAMNLKGEKFETELLNWDQQGERIYSDSMITIYKKDLKIIGLGFESNQTMSKYRILRPRGIIPLDSEENDSTTSTNEDMIKTPLVQ